MNNEFIDGIWFAVQHIVVVRDMPAIAIGIIKESNLSIDDCKAAQKRSEIGRASCRERVSSPV